MTCAVAKQHSAGRADDLVDSHKERTTRYLTIRALATRAFLVRHQLNRYHVLFLIVRAIHDSYKGPVVSTTDKHVRSHSYLSVHQKPALRKFPLHGGFVIRLIASLRFMQRDVVGQFPG